MGPWIYVAMLGLAALIYARMLPQQKEPQKASDQIVKEVEATLEQYAAEIQIENEQLVELVARMKEEHSRTLSHHEQQLQSVNNQLKQGEQEMIMVREQLAGHEALFLQLQQQLAKEEAPPEPALDPTIKDRYSELFAMYQSGKSIDRIAKDTGMQKGEVQLIIQLAKREELS
ncbi:hypothetical protein ACH6EH_07690 [Paenibacillus sp. JSM ZJ436]|uniref:hypothetical protein n=1 Tax=Paenibacillus sp. JSM ZJ436 TaxID=3376190 RepID=UPI0037A28B78